jgi:hypothetical protein
VPPGVGVCFKCFALVVTRPRDPVSYLCAFWPMVGQGDCLSCAFRCALFTEKASCVRVLGPVYLINWINFFFLIQRRAALLRVLEKINACRSNSERTNDYEYGSPCK